MCDGRNKPCPPRNVVDHNQLAVLPDLVADRGLDLQLVPGLQPEVDQIERAAGNPAVFGHARHGGKAHAGGAADYVQNGGNRVNGFDGGDIGFETGRRSLGKWDCHRRYIGRPERRATNGAESEV